MSEEHKSERIRAVAISNGWESVVAPDLEEFTDTGNVADIQWVLYCKRDDETIKAVWKGDRFQTSTYTYGAYRLYPARSGSILRLLQGQPDPRKFAVVNPNATQPQNGEIPRNVPWDDDEEVTAFTVLTSVVNKTITWKGMAGNAKSEFCPADGNLRKAHFRVKTTNAGKRVLEWANNVGFNACYLDSIIDIT